MTDTLPGQVDLLRQRLALVAKLSALNADAHKLAQRLGAAGMDMLRIELEAGRNGASPELVRLLHEAESEAEAIRAGQTRCDEEIAAVERQVEDLDRMIADSGS